MGIIPVVEILFFILILWISGLLSAAEKAMTMTNRNSVKVRAEENNKKAEKLLNLMEKPNQFIYSCLVVRIFLGFLSVGMVLETITTSMGLQFTIWGLPYGTQVAVVLITMIVGGLFMTFGILFPQQIAMKNPESVGENLAGFAMFFSIVCKPFVAFVTLLTRLALKISRQDSKIIEETFSEEEVMSMLEVGQKEGELKEEGRKMIDSIFAFDDKLAYEIMTPRTDVFAIDINDDQEEYMKELMAMTYSRIPIYDDDTDNIIGILNIKDFLIQAKERGFDHIAIPEILRKPFFVPETKNIDSLFFELQKTKQHIAILIDEYGGFSGIVTMEDIIEEVMGEIDDEYDAVERKIEKIDEQSYFIDGLMDLDDINEEIGTDFKSENSETLGGLLIDILGEIPEDNTHPVVADGRYEFHIEEIKGRRIRRVKVSILPAEIETEEEQEGEKQ